MAILMRNRVQIKKARCSTQALVKWKLQTNNRHLPFPDLTMHESNAFTLRENNWSKIYLA